MYWNLSVPPEACTLAFKTLPVRKALTSSFTIIIIGVQTILQISFDLHIISFTILLKRIVHAIFSPNILVRLRPKIEHVLQNHNKPFADFF